MKNNQVWITFTDREGLIAMLQSPKLTILKAERNNKYSTTWKVWVEHLWER